MKPPSNLLAIRLEKLNRLREMGIDPFPHVFKRTHACQEVVAQFAQLEEGEDVKLAGRLRSFRPMGKASFGPCTPTRTLFCPHSR